MTSSDRTATRAGGRHGRPWRAAGAAVVVLLAMVGVGMIGASVRTVPPPRPPQPLAQAGPADRSPSSTAPTTAASSVNGSGTVTTDQASVDDGSTDAPNADIVPTGLPRSTPTTISIPRIGVNAEMMTLGMNPDGTIQVPPLEQAMKAGWYAPGPSPGEVGNAVVVGHVDSAELGPAVFFNLGSLHKGDTINVVRADASTVTFTVDEVKSYPKTAFPTELVYGPSDKPSLRVVTCGGQFDQTVGGYLNNVIAFATMSP